MAKKIVITKGLVKARLKLTKLMKDGETMTKKGLIEAGLLLQGKAQDPSLIPIDTGNLRASAFTAWGDGGLSFINSWSDDKGKAEFDKARHEAVTASENSAVKARPSGKPIQVVVGFSAIYARYQHEGITFNRPNGGGAKWLEIAFVQNVDRMIALITEDVSEIGNQ